MTKGRWDRRRRRWVPDKLSPDYRPMVLDETYDKATEAPVEVSRQGVRHDTRQQEE